jgi:lysozyme family protein
MFDHIMKHILKVEGGFVNHKNDRGGATNFGITKATLEKFRGRICTVTDVKNLSVEEASEIYRRNYWNEMKLDRVLDPRIQMMLMDQGVNRGPKSAIRQAQTVLNELGLQIRPDGVIGPMTLAELNTVNPALFCRRYLHASQKFYASLVKAKPSQSVFLIGWLKRTHDLDEAFGLMTYGV